MSVAEHEVKSLKNEACIFSNHYCKNQYSSQRVYTDGETKEDLRNKDRNFVASFAFCVITFEPIMI